MSVLISSRDGVVIINGIRNYEFLLRTPAVIFLLVLQAKLKVDNAKKHIPRRRYVSSRWCFVANTTRFIIDQKIDRLFLYETPYKYIVISLKKAFNKK